MPDPDDLEAVRARVRTAVDRWTGTDTLVLDKADVLALLAPTLTEEERGHVDDAKWRADVVSNPSRATGTAWESLQRPAADAVPCRSERGRPLPDREAGGVPVSVREPCPLGDTCPFHETVAAADANGIKYEAEKVMDPILRRWFAIDLDPVDAERNAENAAVDLSWHLENVGLLNRPTLIDEEGVEHICDALIEVGPWDEIDGDGYYAPKRACPDNCRELVHDPEATDD